MENTNNNLWFDVVGDVLFKLTQTEKNKVLKSKWYCCSMEPLVWFLCSINDYVSRVNALNYTKMTID